MNLFWWVFVLLSVLFLGLFIFYNTNRDYKKAELYGDLALCFVVASLFCVAGLIFYNVLNS